MNRVWVPRRYITSWVDPANAKATRELNPGLPGSESMACMQGQVSAPRRSLMRQERKTKEQTKHLQVQGVLTSIKEVRWSHSSKEVG
jgi:hypothetical protein